MMPLPRWAPIVLLAIMATTPTITTSQGPSATAQSELRDTVSLYTTDLSALNRRWTVAYAAARRERFRAFQKEWQGRLARIDFDRLGQEGRIDYVLLNTRLTAELDRLTREEQLATDMGPYVPFAPIITEFEEARRRFNPIDPQSSGATLAAMAKQIDSLTRVVRARANATIGRPERIVGLRTVAYLDDLQRTLRDWHRFYAGYHPLFTWWTEDPYKRVTAAMTRYQTAIREVIVGQKAGEEEPIIGDPIGAAGLAEDLRAEMIAYEPAQLIALAEREFKWIEQEQRRAAREMGFGDDWRAALEAVKRKYVPAGEQPALIKALAEEAITFLKAKDLITVPPLAEEIWRMSRITHQSL